MQLSIFSFILQDYYVQQWADNLVFHMTVSDVSRWWECVARLDLASRYGVETIALQPATWDLVAALTDPSGVLWRIRAKARAHP
jgi:uncharacterized glyoxalase superfamily protein PhnB